MGSNNHGLRGSRNSTPVPPELEDLAEKIGEFIQYWGFKKIHGKVWTHIYLSNDALDANELIRRLKVSKALMSFTLNDLLEYGVIKESGKAARNTTLYRANENISEIILNVLRRREKRMLAGIEASFGMLKGLAQEEKEKFGLDPKKVETLDETVNLANETLTSVISFDAVNFNQWQELFK